MKARHFVSRMPFAQPGKVVGLGPDIYHEGP